MEDGGTPDSEDMDPHEVRDKIPNVDIRIPQFDPREYRYVLQVKRMLKEIRRDDSDHNTDNDTAMTVVTVQDMESGEAEATLEVVLMKDQKRCKEMFTVDRRSTQDGDHTTIK